MEEKVSSVLTGPKGTPSLYINSMELTSCPVGTLPGGVPGHCQQVVLQPVHTRETLFLDLQQVSPGLQQTQVLANWSGRGRVGVVMCAWDGCEKNHSWLISDHNGKIGLDFRVQ